MNRRSYFSIAIAAVLFALCSRQPGRDEARAKISESIARDVRAMNQDASPRLVTSRRAGMTATEPNALKPVSTATQWAITQLVRPVTLTGLIVGSTVFANSGDET